MIDRLTQKNLDEQSKLFEVCSKCGEKVFWAVVNLVSSKTHYSFWDDHPYEIREYELVRFLDEKDINAGKADTISCGCL